MVLYAVVPGKMYFQICFEDIPPGYILGGTCFVCQRRGPIDRELIEARYGALSQLRHLDYKRRCRRCGNNTANRFTVVGRSIRTVKELPAGLEDCPQDSQQGKV